MQPKEIYEQINVIEITLFYLSINDRFETSLSKNILWYPASFLFPFSIACIFNRVFLLFKN